MNCVWCQAEIAADRCLCSRCVGKIHEYLDQIPGLMEDLNLTATRQAKLGGGGPRGIGHEHALPFDWAAADLAWGGYNTLTTWVRHIDEERGAA